LAVTVELPQPVLQVPLRRIYALGGEPACFLIDDRDAGLILVNAPAPRWHDALVRRGGVRYLFLPSARGAAHARFWQACGATLLAHPREPLPDDLVVRRVDDRQRLTRTIDFLPLPGATPGTCALHLRNKPGVVFAGPALAGPDALPPAGEDALFSALYLGGLPVHWLFWDDASAPLGPEGAAHLRQRLERLLES